MLFPTEWVMICQRRAHCSTECENSLMRWLQQLTSGSIILNQKCSSKQHLTVAFVST